MVGKGVDSKNSRIFHQCYLKCCKLQNLTPLNNVIPSANGKVLEFCVDRIKYVDWPPILNALSCDLSLHSVTIKCRQQVKTVLEHIDCERLAKTVNKRCVLLTNFMLSNLVEAITQLLSNTTLLTSLNLDGIPLRIPYLNPLCEALSSNNCLQHIYLSRCMIGDAGCIALCNTIRSLPNIVTLDMSGCELTQNGAEHIADLIKYQKIHRYSENWIHTLRYRLPELDTMAGLRRITLCDNPQLGDVGFACLLDVLADDLWIKVVELRGCGITDVSIARAHVAMRANTTLDVLDVRDNNLSAAACATLQYPWLASVSSGSTERGVVVKLQANKSAITRDRSFSNVKVSSLRNTKANNVKKDKDYVSALEEQLEEETSHRRQVEELNVRLAEQMRALKRQQVALWDNYTASSGSDRSLEASGTSGELSTSSCSSSVPIDHSTLTYIQHAFKDIYMYIKNNQCNRECVVEPSHVAVTTEEAEETEECRRDGEREAGPRAHRTRHTATRTRSTRSAHALGHVRTTHMRAMFEKHMGDTSIIHDEESYELPNLTAAELKPYKGVTCERLSPSPSPSPSSSVTLVSRPDPRRALCSSSSSSSSSASGRSDADRTQSP